MTKILILIQCPDKVGLVASVANTIARNNLNIIVMREFVERESETFFARIECAGDRIDREKLKDAFIQQLGPKAVVQVNPLEVHKKIAILVTKEYHCLGDILVKNFFHNLRAEVICVVGNHEDLRSFVENFGVPFYFVSHKDKTKSDFEEELWKVLAPHKPDYLFLAKFMRILSAGFIAHYPHRIVNIHHSFLPAFIGARPYLQAFDRGVKVIGATAHIVTEDLDNGPIIVQKTIDINHRLNPAQLKKAGSEVERTVLAKAMDLILEDRVFIVGNKTIVFD